VGLLEVTERTLEVARREAAQLTQTVVAKAPVGDQSYETAIKAAGKEIRNARRSAARAARILRVQMEAAAAVLAHAKNTRRNA